jgi:hypothetical protein
VEFKILSATADKAEWDDFFDQLPRERQDVHFTSAYARIQESSEPRENQAILAVLEVGQRFVMQPFMLRKTPFDDRYSDLTNLYGYGGPISNVYGSALVYQSALHGWCSDMNIVSEYCCLHPLYLTQQHDLMNERLAVCSHKPVVIIDLANMAPSRRILRGVEAAREAGVIVVEGRDNFTFTKLYDSAMDRKDAAEFWRHDFDYWSRHRIEDVGARFFYALKEKTFRRALLTIGHADTAYAHFLGSDGWPIAGIDALLYFEAAQALKDSGYKFFHLGGGLTADPNDTLLAYKSGFSDCRRMALRCCRTFDFDASARLMMAKQEHEIEMNGRESTAQFFPAYRRPFR